MVKGISRQVIVVQAPEPKLFEQAIFILKEDAVREGITDEVLLREAKSAIRQGGKPKGSLFWHGAFWAAAGAAVTGLCWIATVLI